jgi:hypothetical protein
MIYICLLGRYNAKTGGKEGIYTVQITPFQTKELASPKLAQTQELAPPKLAQRAR